MTVYAADTHVFGTVAFDEKHLLKDTCKNAMQKDRTS